MNRFISCKIGHHCHLAATGETKRIASKCAAKLLILLLSFLIHTHYQLSDGEKNSLDDG